MKISFDRVLEYLFGFSECAKCEKLELCDRKPWLHNEDDCNYRKIENWRNKNGK